MVYTLEVNLYRSKREQVHSKSLRDVWICPTTNPISRFPPPTSSIEEEKENNNNNNKNKIILSLSFTCAWRWCVRARACARVLLDKL